MKTNNKIAELNKIIAEQKALINQLKLEKEIVTNSKKYKLGCLIVKIFGPFKRPILFFYRLFFKNKRKQRRKLNDFFPYFSKYEDNIDFSKYDTDIKALAFYLPQFHEFKENNEWWGKGFTEWTNAKKGKPRFNGHYQPRLPHDDIGFYDLSTIETMKKQISLAKQHKIYGFIFYYYWFSGKRLMEKPVDLLLANNSIDFPFCLCWANENWTRRWDGQDNEILIKQDYSQDDARRFIKDIKPYIIDKRYIRIDGKPIILIYNPDAIPNIEKMINDWRDEAKKENIGDIYIISRRLIFSDAISLPNIDAEFDFPPVGHGFSDCNISWDEELYVFDYKKSVDKMCGLIGGQIQKPYYYTTTMGWDNSSRRKNACFIYANYNLHSFYRWNKSVCDYLRHYFDKSKRFLFVNAWNEWCEGTYLEPDKKYGYANINTLSKSICGLPFITSIDNKENNKKTSLNIAIQIHIFYVELIDEIVDTIKIVPFMFDCYISTNSEEKARVIKEKFKEVGNIKKIIVEIVENIGRDVWPFIFQLKNNYQKYDYICHIHSKKSSRAIYENEWRQYLYSKLFGSKDNIVNIFNTFENNKNIGIICPKTFEKVADQVTEYNGNLDNCKKLCKLLNISTKYLYLDLIFPSGTMFWARAAALSQLFKNVDYKYFEKENNQDNCTFAHAIERSISTIALSQGYETYLLEK